MAGNDVEKGTRDGQNVAIVHDRLRDAILSGAIPAGVTSQVALARELGVGRTPLREALRMLQREGLVISEPNRPVRVAPLSPADAEELYVMRAALEAAAARVTVPELGSDGIAELEGLMAQMEHYARAGDGDGLRSPHRAFHARLVATAGGRVATAIAQLYDHAERYRVSCGGSAASWGESSAEHRRILDAAADGDAELTARRLLEHYARASAAVFTGLDPGYEPARLRMTLGALAPGAERALAA